jgi:hypothetical protein
MYIVILFCIWQIIKKNSAAKAAALLATVALVQWIDISAYFTHRDNTYFRPRKVYRSELSDPAWARLGGEYAHIFFGGAYIKLYDFLYLAADYKMTVNDAYLARKNTKLIEENKRKELEALEKGEIRDDTIYVFENKDLTAPLKESGLVFYELDGVCIGLSSQKAYLEQR